MKLAVFSHCVIDSIKIGGASYEQVGGPACYCSWTARNLKLDVDLFTKFGSDFDSENYLTKNKINFSNSLSEKLTTQFRINIADSDRTLYLEKKCEPIEYSDIDADGTVVSPVFDEISTKTYDSIKQNSNFTFLDPQGFLRRVDSNNKIFLEKTEIDLSNVSAIKTSPSEIRNLVGNDDQNAMKNLQKKGVKYVLFTNKREISMLDKDRIYSLTLPNREIYDSIGIGDIFSSTFCSTFLKEKDSIWAFCFASGAAQAAIESKKVGLEKVPKKGATETNASYFYNTMKFRQV